MYIALAGSVETLFALPEPTPRILILTLPREDGASKPVRPGEAVRRSEILTTPRASISSARSAVIDIGVSCILSAFFWAVTMTSSIVNSAALVIATLATSPAPNKTVL